MLCSVKVTLCYKRLFFFWLTVYQGYVVRTGAKGAIEPVNFVKEAQIAPVNQTSLNILILED